MARVRLERAERDAADECSRLYAIISGLKQENAKLRKIVEEMHPFAKAYMSIAVNLGCNDDKSFDWEMCMRELRIEVD